MAETLTALPTPAEPPRSHVGQTARNILSNWGGYAFSLALNFFMAPFVVRHLGDSAYGVWVLLISLTGYLGLLDMGVRGAVTRYVAKFHTAGKDEEASRVGSSALVIFTIAGGVAVALSVFLALFALRRFFIPPDYFAAAQIVLAIGGLSVATSLIGGVFGGILVGLRRFDIVKGLEVVSAGLRALAIVILLKAGQGLVALACVQFAFALATCLVNIWFSFRLFPRLRIRLSACDRPHLRLIVGYSIYSFLLYVADYLIYYTDMMVIGAFLPVALITFFSIAGSLVKYARGLVSGVSQAISPLASALEAQHKTQELRAVTLHASRFATLLVLPCGLTFMLRGSTFIGLWMGGQYAELAGRVLWILSIPLILFAGNQVAFSVLFGISKHKVMLPVTLVEAAWNLAMSLALVSSMGIVGVAWGTAVPSLTINLLFWPWWLRRLLGIPIRSYVVSIWVRPALAMVPFALCTYAIEKFWPVENLGVFFVQVGMALPLAVLGAWFVCLTRWERQTYAQRLVIPFWRVFGSA